MADVIRPAWPAPRHVQALVTTRRGGASAPPWDSWNLGDHVGDDPAAVARNRQRLATLTGLPPHQHHWLKQVHGTRVVPLPQPPEPPEADASWTRTPAEACAILTADCLPVLFCDTDGHQVAAAHAGWRSLAGGILEKTVATFSQPDTVLAWLGPAIGPNAFQVGPEVRAAFVDPMPALHDCFHPDGDRYLANLYQIARRRLARAGVHQIYGGDFCTHTDINRFYSFRRDGQTGRMASVIWMT